MTLAPWHLAVLVLAAFAAGMWAYHGLAGALAWRRHRAFNMFTRGVMSMPRRPRPRKRSHR